MKTGNIVKKGLRVIALLLVLIVIGITLFLYQTLPQRDGELNIPGLKEKVEVIYDAWGVPHIYASNEEDAYRALGYVHAQDRLFQMEMTRRLAKGELAEVLGKKLLKTDKFFRTLWIKGFAKEYVKTIPGDNKALVLSKIYLEGVNHFLETGPTPIEFHLIGIPKKPFTLEDSFAIGGYISYSFASAFKTDPLLSYIKETYGAAYLKDLGYYSAKETIPGAGMHAGNYETLADLGLLAVEIEETTSPIGMFEGSNAWVISGSKTKSGKPILASDPHVKFSIPSVWYEAHVWAPGFELYGHYLAGVPMAMLGHNRHMGWGITMFKNDDINFFTEKVNPENPGEVWQNGKWE
ncbi:MAG: penicillin acylase family protein, partial [bacterium]|nr:penicillin acylase family protein [bacterium]